MVIDLRTALPRLLPRAVAWAEQQQANILASGFPLSLEQITVARTVGVSYPQNIRIRLVNRLPLGPNMTGLTLYYGILICDHAYGSRNLIAHECRHVHQYEQRGSIAAFLQEYLLQIVTVGYDNAPFERDACLAAAPYT